MKILYAVQATGNGHISRSMELLPHLTNYGSVDIFLSGANCSLQLDAPVKYRSNGLSLFYNCNGGLDYWKIVKEMHVLRLRKEIQDLPVEKYDLVINDFDYITAAACAKKKIPSINYGHQASFISNNTPRPLKKSSAGEWILKNYAKASAYVGLHFEKYDDFIFTPVIKQEILDAEPTNKNYVTVYLPSWCEPQLKDIFGRIRDYQFQVFSGETTAPTKWSNILFLPVDKKMFNQSMIHCNGIITGGGFETPAEALHLGKKIISVPIKGQYEQVCNAAALKKMGIKTMSVFDDDFITHFDSWINEKKSLQKDYSRSVDESLGYLFSLQESLAHDIAHAPVLDHAFKI
jgi:uncharacterized protein (TIGR00661 family)